MSRLLPQSFFARDALIVARGLLGKLVRRGPVTLRISETEAYRWPHDSANHCRMGRTPRNEPMWGPAGHAYVYLCFGLHHMLNVVTGGPGEGEAVLIRACEPISGLAQITARRGGKRGPALLTGPGKVGQALAIDPSWSGHALFRRGGLSLLDGETPARHLVGPRVGIDYAEPADRDAPWRFALADTPWVSRRSSLRVAQA